MYSGVRRGLYHEPPQQRPTRIPKCVLSFLHNFAASRAQKAHVAFSVSAAAITYSHSERDTFIFDDLSTLLPEYEVISNLLCSCCCFPKTSYWPLKDSLRKAGTPAGTKRKRPELLRSSLYTESPLRIETPMLVTRCVFWGAILQHIATIDPVPSRTAQTVSSYTSALTGVLSCHTPRK